MCGSENCAEEGLWSNIGGFGGIFGGGTGHIVNLNENPRGFFVSTEGAGTKSRGAGRHRGGTKEAPGRHQGGTKEAPRRNLHINMGPRAAPIKRTESYNTITVHNSGHKILTQ